MAALFALGGVLGLAMGDWLTRFENHFGLMDPLYYFDPTALPFALLSVALFLRSWKALLSAPLNLAVWMAAHDVAMRIAERGSPIRGLFLAGFLGGLGVALADSICRPKLLFPAHLFCTAFIGCAAAWAFFVFMPYLPAGFAVWQACVGTYLYFACTSGKRPADTAASLSGAH